MKNFYCNKCNKKFNEYELNNLEIEEIMNNLKNEGVPSFVCSDCINEEMNEEINEIK